MARTDVSSSAPQRLLERDAELGVIARAVDRAGEGTGGAILIEGSAGIGKTALLGLARARAEREGLQVLRATGRELERGFAFGVCLQLFVPALAAVDPEGRERLLSGAVSPVAVLMGAAPPAAPLPDQAFAIVHGFYWLAANLVERRPLALLVDDVHRADPPSLQALAYLTPRVPELPLALIMTRRSGEPGASEPGWPEAPELEILRPAPLSAPATAVVVREIVGSHAGEELLHACHTASGGNPFLLCELARAIAETGLDRHEDALERIGQLVPDRVSRAMLSRLQQLDPPARALAKAVAVLERGELRHAAALAELDETAAAAAAAGLADAGVLARELPLHFAHPMLRTAVYSDLSPATRQLWHRRAARLLANAGANPDVVSSHLLEAEPHDEAWAADVLRETATRALAQGAPEIAARALERALAERPDQPDRPELLLDLAHAQLAGGDPNAFGSLEAVLASSEQPLTRAGAYAALGAAHFVAGHLDAAAEAARTGLAELAGHDAPQLEVRLVYPYLSGTYGSEDLTDDVQAVLQRASSGESSVADSGRAAALAWHEMLRGEPAGDVARLARIALADERLIAVGFEGFLLRGVAAQALATAGEVEEALAAYEDLLENARRRGSQMLRVATTHLASWCRWAEQGLLPEALADLQVMLEWSAPPWEARAALAHVLRSEVLIDRGDIAGAAADLASAEQLLPRTPASPWKVWHPFVRSRLRLEQGDTEGALADALAAGEGWTGIGVENPAFCPWRSRAALAAARLGDVERARGLCAEELQLARRCAVARAIGTALRSDGTITRGEEGIDLLTQAVGVLAASPARLEHARALVDLGAALRRAARRADAADPLREGMDLAHRCGATALVERGRSELVAMGSRPRRVATTGREALTPSELQVCELAAEGLGNRDIAQRLFITRRTVETHLTHAYQKLGITKRAQLSAALAGELTPDLQR